MHRTPTPRKAQFDYALALDGMTARQWCNERDLTEAHVYRVLMGDRHSERLTHEVDKYIRDSMKRAKTRATGHSERSAAA